MFVVHPSTPTKVILWDVSKYNDVLCDEFLISDRVQLKMDPVQIDENKLKWTHFMMFHGQVVQRWTNMDSVEVSKFRLIMWVHPPHSFDYRQIA